MFSKPLVLQDVKLAEINQGGYSIKWSGDVPKDHKVVFCVKSDRYKMDVTKGYKSGQLKDLLTLIGKASAWSQCAECFVALEKGGKVVKGSPSKAQVIYTPVAPHNGGLGLKELGKTEYTYPGNGKGRYLTKKIGGKYYFKYGVGSGQLVTDPAMRGFDCTTYVGSAFGLQSGMNAYGSQLAKKLGAKKVDMECKKSDEVVEFFTKGKGKSGTYIMFTEKHVMTVINGVVFEFTYGGFKKTKIASKKLKKLPHWVRKL